MKILYVDDDPLMLRAIDRQLTGRGHDVWVETHPTSILETKRFDVALLDWHPHGPDMVDKCRAAGVPFVIYTGNPEDVTVGYPVLIKPATTGEIVDALLVACGCDDKQLRRGGQR